MSCCCCLKIDCVAAVVDGAGVVAVAVVKQKTWLKTHLQLPLVKRC